MAKYTVGQKLKTTSVIQATGAIIPEGQVVVVEQVTESRTDRYRIQAFDGWVYGTATEKELTDEGVAAAPIESTNYRYTPRKKF